MPVFINCAQLIDLVLNIESNSLRQKNTQNSKNSQKKSLKMAKSWLKSLQCASILNCKECHLH